MAWRGVAWRGVAWRGRRSAAFAYHWYRRLPRHGCSRWLAKVCPMRHQEPHERPKAGGLHPSFCNAAGRTYRAAGTALRYAVVAARRVQLERARPAAAAASPPVIPFMVGAAAAATQGKESQGAKRKGRVAATESVAGGGAAGQARRHGAAARSRPARSPSRASRTAPRAQRPSRPMFGLTQSI